MERQLVVRVVEGLTNAIKRELIYYDVMTASNVDYSTPPEAVWHKMKMGVVTDQAMIHLSCSVAHSPCWLPINSDQIEALLSLIAA